MLQLYTEKDNRTGPQTIELLTRRIVNLGAMQAGQFLVDCEVYQGVAPAPPQQQQQPGSVSNKQLYILHSSEHPASVFSILESPTKTVTLTSDTLFDLLMLKLTNVYKKKQAIESRGPRFEIGDFIVKLGSVTVGGVFKVKKSLLLISIKLLIFRNIIQRKDGHSTLEISSGDPICDRDCSIFIIWWK